MKKIILTSAGFENKKIQDKFLELINKPSNEIMVLFIPTAAINADAIAMLPKCMNDLLDAKIPKENVHVYDLHKEMALEKLMEYDAIYFCGGSTSYLLDRINEIKFNVVLKEYVQKGGVFVGVSAGSMIAVQNRPNNLGFINCLLSVHCEEGSKLGKIDTSNCPKIKLTNNQAILLTDDWAEIIE
ncbi:Type 1 glutamine amidotransferase-like domain-containing protein [Clostridium paridis]|uniref:Type 1 glutamine amidotransferase-like domain-containing protein n=1 Tax=Clostridium paridis TaxID=2803863 RepID=A0A937FG76_9CLOT|nr:Type 1 glutamine amidotransferase-like domain-containing protein [Clostridium paridis]MBL4933219.1 Type 1 glutamine amidotransferase-like domain-containing protein [Clostridium paridis]